MGKIIGIDLVATNSAVAVIESGKSTNPTHPAETKSRCRPPNQQEAHLIMFHLRLLSVILILCAASPAWAALGEYESSVDLDARALRGSDRIEPREAYRVHEITAANGLVVKEYVSPAGLVFGVSWQSSTMPNLQPLLGNSMADLQAALSARTGRAGRGPLIVRTARLVFTSGGHMRAFHGYAYVPSLVPERVSPEAVR